MAFYQNEAPSVNVGDRLRELRISREMSLRVLAMKSGLSIHTLSMIEKGKTSPAISTLYKLAEALDVPLTFFFNPDNNRKQVIFLKSDERTHMPFTRGIVEGLGGENFVGNVEPYMVTLESSANSGPQVMSHSGHEFVLCLRGTLEYQVEHQTYELAPGDSILFAANLKHRWKNPGRTVATALIVVSGFDDDSDMHGIHWKAGE
ncbi:MAG: cupin domain-containing protein [Anaerolineales bacterium]